MPLSLLMKLYCDSKSAINIAHNLVLHDRTKHIEIDKDFIKEKMEDDTPFVPIIQQATNILTKDLVRDAKIKVLSGLKQSTEEERLEWKKLSASLKSEYPKYTPLLAKILEGLLTQNIEDKIQHNEEIIGAADELIDSVDTDELAKYFSLKSDPDDEGAEKTKKKMETTREQLAEALYQKGLAIAEIDSLKGEKVVDKEDTQAASDSSGESDLFEENFKELQKWVDMKSSKYGTLSVTRERRKGCLGTALKVLNDMIQEDGHPPKKKFYELKLLLLEQIGWGHLVTYETQWMSVRFPANLPLF